jgi:hypothetical protein
VKWPNFKFAERVYDLTHLHPHALRFERPAEGTKPHEHYDVDVIFGLHCFTRGPRPGEVVDPASIYPDGYEYRLFDAIRYEHSFRLLEIIQSLPSNKPRHNGSRGNFFTLEITTKDGQTVEYNIFFKVKKVAKGQLQLFVESAFVRDPAYNSTRPKGIPVRFWVILHNTLNGKKIRT